MPVFALMVIFMVVIFGAAVDVTRTVNAREKLSYALDAGALAVASELSTSVLTDAQILQVLTDSFRGNLDGASFMEKAIDNLDFTIDSDNGIVTVTSSATLNNYFIDIGGYMQKSLGPETFSFGAKSQVTYSRFNVELALVVDVTGSMSSSDMRTLRAASTSAVNILLPEDTPEKDAKVRISLVPYSQGVNLGDYASKVKGGDFYSVSGNCVTERQDYKNYEVMLTDATYDYYLDANPPPIQTFFGGGSSNCSSTSKMVPLTRDRDTLLPAIAALTDKGGTAGQTGIAWGWYSLSPNFANVWPEASIPAAYSDSETLKFAILMTDGDNNRYYRYVETEEKCGWSYSRGSWRWRCQDVEVNDWKEQSESENYDNTSSTRSRALCEGMKDAGIEVFGVYFGTSNSSAGAKNMQSCASEGNYYQASSSDELVQAFANIARKIQAIYLSK
ncbi:pilus assembly protein TadG-related protein [Roseibium sp.]|uniref:pilus assembly protein TadG-related protein n=1 Tax=Roseibium sp. TaxID=1936156 RepID=UPI003D0A9FE8